MENKSEPSKITLKMQDRFVIYGTAIIFLVIITYNNLPFIPHALWVLPLYFIVSMILVLVRRAISNDWS